MKYICFEELGVCRCNPDVFKIKEHAEGWNALYDIIANAPDADVKPIVQCKDCQNRYEFLFCGYMGDNDYCSKGMKKD